MSDLLMIFVKNPVPGTVKTRLAADIGDDAALRIYLQLMDRTREISSRVPVSRWLYYSDRIDKEDQWGTDFDRKLQKGNALGDKIANAFEDGFGGGFGRVCIIGSDCYELSESIVKEAYHQLDSHDFVVGPAVDGGYYLLGMKKFEPQVFSKIDWSTAAVLDQTLRRIKALEKSCYQLPSLTDIDTIDDLRKFPELKY